jgi:hypothetical protein
MSSFRAYTVHGDNPSLGKSANQYSCVHQRMPEREGQLSLYCVITNQLQYRCSESIAKESVRSKYEFILDC